MLVPQMSKLRERYSLRGVVSRDTTRGGNFARSNRVEVFATNIEAVLDDPSFDLIVIATRHHEHAQQTAAGLRAGKHVFVEKPLALSWEQLDEVVEAANAEPGNSLLMVGFNRRFSPALQVLRAELMERRSPLMMSYRLNGGYIAPDSWVQGSQGGGRNLGEACHMYDVFRFLADAPVETIDATAINPGNLPYLRNDNFCATLSYQDGSVGNLTYTALGPKQGMPKERIEVFCDGEAYLVDDFKKLVRTSDGEVIWESRSADKGHLEELSRLGDAIISGGPAPISCEELVETTSVALYIEDLLQGRSAPDAG